MKYEHYTESEFLKDDFFVKWAKESDPETNFFWEKWIENHPEQKKTILRAKWIIGSINYTNTHDLSDKEYTSLYESILKNDEDYFVGDPPLRRFSTWIKMAAVVAILLCSTIIIYNYNNTGTEISKQQVSYISHSANMGEKALFSLQDGTRVRLNSGSTIRYPEVFSKDGKRVVYLEGEAFFKVAKDQSRPFIVKSGLVSTRVTGTEFNVRNNFEDGTVQVALREGEVVVTSDKFDKSFVLKPTEMITCTEDNIDVSYFDEDEVMGWTRKKLVFRNDSAEAVKIKLERWFGVEIMIEGDNMFEDTYTGTFRKETLQNVLKGISYTVQGSFSYEIEGKTVFIKKNEKR